MADVWCRRCKRYTGHFHRCFVYGIPLIKPLKGPPKPQGEGLIALKLLARLKQMPELKDCITPEMRCLRQFNGSCWTEAWSWSLEPHSIAGSGHSMSELLAYEKWETCDSRDGLDIGLSKEDTLDALRKRRGGGL